MTVAISTRGRADELERCLESLLESDVRPDEIVVVDQSEDDATERVVQRFAEAAVPLRLIRDHGQGLGRAQNLAVSHARHALIAITDDDCIVASDWLAAVARAFHADPALAGVTGRVLPLEPEPPRVFPVSTREGAVRRRFFARALPWEVGSGNNFAVRREWFLRAGGCDERLGPGAPGRGALDMDLFYRLLRAGGAMRFEPDLVVFHRRATHADRIVRRFPYGYGMGAFCALWLRRGDLYSIWIFARWSGSRLRRLFGGASRGDWLRVREEMLVLRGTAHGLVQGFRLNSDRTGDQRAFSRDR